MTAHISYRSLSTEIKHFMEEIMSIGREDCDIIVSHPMVSRHHLKIKWEDTVDGFLYKMVDCSTNGTIIDGEMIHNREKYWLIFGSGATYPSILLAGVIEIDFEKVMSCFSKHYN